jgi:hypothetical protein
VVKTRIQLDPVTYNKVRKKNAEANSLNETLYSFVNMRTMFEIQPFSVLFISNADGSSV